MPLVAIAASAIVYFKFKTELLNLVVPSNLFEAFSDKEERFIARKLSGLLAQSYTSGKLPLKEELVEYQLVD